MDNLNRFPSHRPFHHFNEGSGGANSFNLPQMNSPFSQLHGNNQRFPNQLPIDFPVHSHPNYHDNIPNFQFQQKRFCLDSEHTAPPSFSGIPPFFRQGDLRTGHLQMNNSHRIQNLPAQHLYNNDSVESMFKNQQQRFRMFHSQKSWHTRDQPDGFPLRIPLKNNLDFLPMSSGLMPSPLTCNLQNQTFQNLPSLPIKSFSTNLESSTNQIKEKQNVFKENVLSLVESWLKTRASDTKKEQQRFLRIFEYKDLLKEYITLMNSMRDLTNSLAENITINESQWQVLINEGKSYKEILLKMKEQLFNDQQIDFIASNIKSRKKKRDRLRRKKKQESEEYIASISKRMKLHEQIDDDIHKKQMEILRQKMVDNLKNEAGESLVEVKRKQYETDERITVFQLLKDLRDLRKETSIYKGILPTESENASFDATVTNAIELLKKQRKIYEDEEKALRVLREEETEVFNRLENEKQKKRKQTRRLDLYTFDPMIPFRMYWLQSEESIASLIHIRSLWDLHLAPIDSPESSRIPEGFIHPAPPSNSEWRKYVVKVKPNKAPYK